MVLPLTVALASLSPAERALQIFKAHGAILGTQQALKLGIHARTLYELRDDAKLERLERGLYRLARAKPLRNPDLVTVALKVPRGVVCLISALAFHHMTTQIPHAVHLAIPASSQAPALRYPPLRLFWYSKAVHESGVVVETLDNMPVRVYSPEKTLADCFKFRNKLGTDICVEALHLYRRRGRIKLNLIERYAKVCRVERVMCPYLEAIL
jgi:predicted transcriptional regulator of viral defense system